MNDQNVVPSHDLETSLKDLQIQLSIFSTSQPGWLVSCELCAAYAIVDVVLQLNSIDYIVAERLVEHIECASNYCEKPHLNFQPALTLAKDILADMPIPYRVVDGVL